MAELELRFLNISVEIPTRCSFVIEFIIPKFFEGSKHVSSGTSLIIRSTKLYLQPLVYMPIWWLAVAKYWQRPVTIWAYKPEVANTV